MQSIDYLVIVAYFALVIGIGFWYQRRASRNLDNYFLGGKRIYWLALAMSGSVSNFDITGTMWIVTLITGIGGASTVGDTPSAHLPGCPWRFCSPRYPGSQAIMHPQRHRGRRCRPMAC